MLIYRVQQIGQMVNELDVQVSECYMHGIDCSYLMAARGALMNHLVTLKQSLAYKMDLWDNYGVPLDEGGAVDLYGLVEEVGYDRVSEIYGDGLDEALAILETT